MRYYDKNGAEIKVGMYLCMEDGSIEKVYACTAQNGEKDLGITASNEEYLRINGMDSEFYREYYSLSNFNLRKVEIIEQEQQMQELFL